MGSGGADWNDGIGRRFGSGNGEWGAVARFVDDRILEESKMALVVAPGAGHSHEVGGEFAEHDFDLLVRRFALDACEGGVWHLGLDTIGGHSIGHGGTV